GLEVRELLADPGGGLVHLVLGRGGRRRRRVHHRLAVRLPPRAQAGPALGAVVRVEEVNQGPADQGAHQHPWTKHVDTSSDGFRSSALTGYRGGRRPATASLQTLDIRLIHGPPAAGCTAA